MREPSNFFPLASICCIAWVNDIRSVITTLAINNDMQELVSLFLCFYYFLNYLICSQVMLNLWEKVSRKKERDTET